MQRDGASCVPFSPLCPGELDHVVLVAVVSDRLVVCLGDWERAGGAGRDQPKSRSPAGRPTRAPDRAMKVHAGSALA